MFDLPSYGKLFVREKALQQQLEKRISAATIYPDDEPFRRCFC
jgi:hypothetical protein